MIEIFTAVYFKIETVKYSPLPRAMIQLKHGQISQCALPEAAYIPATKFTAIEKRLQFKRKSFFPPDFKLADT